MVYLNGTVLGICFFDILKLDSFPNSAKIYVFCLNLCRLKIFLTNKLYFYFVNFHLVK